MCRIEERCDQISHCKDKSDENNCKLIVFEDNYNNKVPPFTINKDKSVEAVKVNVSTSLMNILAISEFDHTIHLKLGITLKWYENRVLYHNLKDSEALNTLTDSEVSALNPNKQRKFSHPESGEQAVDPIHNIPKH